MEQRGLLAVQFPPSDSRLQAASERLYRAATELPDERCSDAERVAEDVEC